MGCGQSTTAVSDGSGPGESRRQSVILPPPEIPVNIGANVKFHPPPATKVFVIIGEGGSRNTAVLGSLVCATRHPQCHIKQQLNTMC